jgi:hypothetical protein
MAFVRDVAVFPSYQPCQAVIVQSNPNLPKDWKIGFGNRALPFIDVVQKAEQFISGNISVISPHFSQAKDLEIFDGRRYLYLPENILTERAERCFQHVFKMDPYATREDYDEIFLRFSSVAVIPEWETNSRFDQRNWLEKAKTKGVDQRPGGIYRPFDVHNQKQMHYYSQKLNLQNGVDIPSVTFKEESVKAVLYLRVGRYGGDVTKDIREEYPGKFFNDQELGVPSGEIDGEEFRMSPMLIVHTLEEILEDPRFQEERLHVQIMSDISGSGTREKEAIERKKVIDWFEKQFEGRPVSFSFENSNSLWRDLYGAPDVEYMIGPDSDFIRSAFAKNLEAQHNAGIDRPLQIYMPKPDVTVKRGNGFLQPNPRYMEHHAIDPQ